jgi:hypothetical protein
MAKTTDLPSNSWLAQLNLWLWRSGVKKVRHLSPEQKALLSAYKENWLKITLSTEPVDKLKAESALDWVYRCVNLEPPKIKLWLDNPYQGCLGAYFITVLCQLSENKQPPKGKTSQTKPSQTKPFEALWQEVKATIQQKLGPHCWTADWEATWQELKTQIENHPEHRHIIIGGDPVWHLTENGVFAQIKNRFRVKVWLDEKATEKTEVDPKVITMIREAISTPVAQQARDQYIHLCNERITQTLQHLAEASPLPHETKLDAKPNEEYDTPWESSWLGIREVLQKASSGAHKCYNLSFFSYLMDVCNLPMDVLYGVWQGAEHCGWYWRFGGVAIMIPKPSVLQFKDGKLHSEGGPAIAFPGGFEVYAHMGERYTP